MGIGLMDLLQGPNHPEQVGKAYGLLNDKLKRDEQGAFDESFTSNFNNYKDLMDKGKGKEAVNSWKETDYGTPLERWRKQIDGMIQSGNPVLVKEGMSLLSAQHSRETSPPGTEAAMSTAGKMAAEMGLKPGSEPFNRFVRDYAFKKGTKQYAPKYVTPAEAKSLRWEDKDRGDPIVGQNWEDIRGAVRTVDDGQEMRDNAGSIIGTLKDALFNEESGIYNDEIWQGEGLGTVIKGGIGGAIKDITQSDARYKAYSDIRGGSAAQIVRALGEKGALSDKDITRALNMLPNISGLRGIPDTPEVSKLKFKYLELMLQLDPSQWKPILDMAESELGTVTTGDKPVSEDDGWEDD